MSSNFFCYKGLVRLLKLIRILKQIEKNVEMPENKIRLLNNSINKSIQVRFCFIQELSLSNLFNWMSKYVSNDGFQVLKRHYEL